MYAKIKQSMDLNVVYYYEDFNCKKQVKRRSQQFAIKNTLTPSVRKSFFYFTHFLLIDKRNLIPNLPINFKD